jgi:hypothetical protein
MQIARVLPAMLVLAMAFAASASAQSLPMMRTLDPYSAKAGAEIVVTGDNLGKEAVAEVFIRAEGKDTKVEVTSQAEKEVKFKVPNVKPGPYRVVVLTKSSDPTLVEEPVRLVVEQ